MYYYNRYEDKRRLARSGSHFAPDTYDDRYYYYKGKRQFEFDEKSLNVYAGLGKKFGRKEEWSWFLTLRRTDTSYSDVHNDRDRKSVV